jgi:hypothetical protein
MDTPEELQPMRSRLFSGWGYGSLLERLLAAYEKGIAWVARGLPKGVGRVRERRRGKALKCYLALEGLENRLVPTITNYVPLATFSYTESLPGAPPILATFTDADCSPPGLSCTSGLGAVVGLGGSSYEVQGTCPYTDEGSYTDSVTVTDFNSSASGSTAFTVLDATLTAGSASVPSPVEGASASTVFTFTDANISATGSDFSGTVDWGDGSTSSITAVTETANVFYTGGSHTYTEEAASRTVVITVNDDGGQSTTTTFNVTVTDAALSATQTFTPTPIENTALSGASLFTFADANSYATSADFTAVVNWGDGTSESSASSSNVQIGGGYTVTGTHTYTEEATGLTLTVSVTDDGGSSTSSSTTVNVSDPHVNAVGGHSFTSLEGATTGTLTLATFTDPAGAESLANYSASVDWGDTHTSSGTITYDSGTGIFTVTGSHTYTDDSIDSGHNPYTITVTVHHETSTDQAVTDTDNVLRPTIGFQSTVYNTTEPAPGSAPQASAAITVVLNTPSDEATTVQYETSGGGCGCGGSNGSAVQNALAAINTSVTPTGDPLATPASTTSRPRARSRSPPAPPAARSRFPSSAIPLPTATRTSSCGSITRTMPTSIRSSLSTTPS